MELSETPAVEIGNSETEKHRNAKLAYPTMCQHP